MLIDSLGDMVELDVVHLHREAVAIPFNQRIAGTVNHSVPDHQFTEGDACQALVWLSKQPGDRVIVVPTAAIVTIFAEKMDWKAGDSLRNQPDSAENCGYGEVI